jgi:hypothetical protein
MRSFLTYGFISLVGVAALYACGDDSGDGTTGPQGGSGGSAGAGTGGSAGGSSMAGSGGGGAAGMSGSGGSGGATGATANCQGCVLMEIPFSAASQAALYQIVYAAPGLDFSNATITWKVQVLSGAKANLFVKPQIQNGMALNYAGYYNAPMTALTAAAFPANTFVDVVLNTATIPAAGGGADAGADGGAVDAGDAGDAGAAPAAGAFDKTKVEQLQIQFGSTAAFTGTQNLAVEIDSVAITGVMGTTGATFTTGVEGLTLNNYAGSPTPVGTGAPSAH